MEILFSNISNLKNKEKTSDYVEMLAIANFYIKQLGFKTTFFGNDISLELHKNIEFDYFKIIPNDFINSMPKCFWSMSKLYALRQTNSPFLHIDSDLFITKPFTENFLQNDVVCFHSETFVNFIQLQKLFDIRPKECLNFPVISYNCGVMGGQDFNSWHKAIDIVFNFLIENKYYLENIADHYNNDSRYENIFYPSVLFEQIWLYQVLKFLGKNNIKELIMGMKDWKGNFAKLTRKTGYIHLMETKSEFAQKKTFKKIVEFKNIKY